MGSPFTSSSNSPHGEAPVSLCAELEEESLNVYRRNLSDYQPALQIFHNGFAFTVKFWNTEGEVGETVMDAEQLALAFGLDKELFEIVVIGLFARVGNRLAVYDSKSDELGVSIILTEELTEAMRTFLTG